MTGYPMRRACSGCEHTGARLSVVSGQVVARCERCDRYAYHVPEAELRAKGWHVDRSKDTAGTAATPDPRQGRLF